VLDLAEVLNQEARALQAAGAPVIQFDEPAILKHKEDFPLFQEAMTRLTQGLNPTLALYTYFDDIAGVYPAFLKLPFQVFGLDYVMGKANWDVVVDVPSDVSLGLGVVNARNTRMETEEEIGDALRRIAPVVPQDRLYINPNCGLEFLPRDTAYQKLVRMVEGSKKAMEVAA
jgi:5-methyltetrahydropteroyltriglutamate--homocysteine methyltransferase